MTDPQPPLFNADDAFFTSKELAARWKLHPVTLATWRVRGWGPKFTKLGQRVRYPLAIIEDWERSRLRQNTSLIERLATRAGRAKR